MIQPYVKLLRPAPFRMAKKAFLDAFFDCTHPKAYIVKKGQSDGRWTFREECGDCGWVGPRPLKKCAALDQYGAESLVPWMNEENHAKHVALKEQVIQWLNTVETIKGLLWWQIYNEYLNSQEWRDKRLRVLKRDGYICQRCRIAVANHVHHNTYSNICNEPLDDLISVCAPCHAAIHNRTQLATVGGQDHGW